LITYQGATVSNIDRCRYKYLRSITKSKGYLISKNRDNYLLSYIEKLQNIEYDLSHERLDFIFKIDHLTSENAELKQVIADLKGGTENPEQNTKFNELEKEVAYLKSQVEIVTDLRNRYQEECEKLKSENAGFNKRIDTLNVEIAKLKDINLKLYKEKEYYKEVMQDLKDKYEDLTTDKIYMYENADNCTTENINMSAVTDHTTSSADNKVAAVKQPETTDNADIDKIVADLTSKDEKVIPFKGHRFNPEDAKDEIDMIVAELTSNNNTETEVIKLSAMPANGSKVEPAVEDSPSIQTVTHQSKKKQYSFLDKNIKHQKYYQIGDKICEGYFVKDIQFQNFSNDRVFLFNQCVDDVNIQYWLTDLMLKYGVAKDGNELREKYLRYYISDSIGLTNHILDPLLKKMGLEKFQSLMRKINKKMYEPESVEKYFSYKDTGDTFEWCKQPSEALCEQSATTEQTVN
jgi:hypothetical protein